MSAELLTQSRLLTDLNQVISNIASTHNAINDSITAQIEMTRELNESLSVYSERMNSINISAQNMASQFINMTTQTFNPSAAFNMAMQRNQNTSFDTIRGLNASADEMNGAADQARQMDQHLRADQQRGEGSFDTARQQEATGTIEEATEAIETATEEAQAHTGRLREWFNKTNIGKGLSSGLGKWSLLITIPKLLFSVVSVVTNFVTAAVGIIADMSKSLLTLPFTIARTFIQPANELRQKIVEGIGNTLESYKDSFDLDSYIGKGAVKLSQTLIGSLKTFQDNRSKLSRLFGHDSPEAALAAGKEMVEGLGHFGERFGRGILGNIDNLVYITEAQKAMGLSAEELKYYALEAATSTGSIVDTLDENLRNLNKISKQYNIDFKNTSRVFNKLRLDISDFGHLTSRELSQVSAKLIQLKVSADDAAGLFQKFSSFEEAANTSAQLFQSFGMVIDAYDLVAANDPVEIIMMLRDGMVNSGKNFEMLNRHERSLLKGLTGLSDQALSTTFSFKNLSMSQEEMRKKLKSEDPTATQLKTIRSLTSAIKQIKKVLTFDSPFDALWKGLKMNTGTQKEMIAIEVQLSQTYENLNRHARNINFNKIEKFTRPLNLFLTKFTKMVLDGRLTTLFSSGLEAAGILMEAVSASFEDTPNVNNTDITNRLTAKLTSMFEAGADLFGDLYNLGTMIAGTLVRGTMKGITILAKLIAMDADEIADKFNITFSDFGFKQGEYDQLKGDLLKAGDTFANQNSGKMWGCFTYLIAEVTKMSGFFLKVLKDVVYLGLIAVRENVPDLLKPAFDFMFPTANYKRQKDKMSRNANESSIQEYLNSLKSKGNADFEEGFENSIEMLTNNSSIVQYFIAGTSSAGMLAGAWAGAKGGAAVGGVGGTFVAPGVGTTIGAGVGGFLGMLGGGYLGYKLSRMTAEEIIEAVIDSDDSAKTLYSLKKFIQDFPGIINSLKSKGFDVKKLNDINEEYKKISIPDIDRHIGLIKEAAARDIPRSKVKGWEESKNKIRPYINEFQILEKKLKEAVSEKQTATAQDLFVKLHDNDGIEIIASKQGGLLRNLFRNIKEKYQRTINDTKVMLNNNKEKIFFEEEDEDQVILDFIDKVNIYIDKVNNRKIKVNHNSLSFK